MLSLTPIFAAKKSSRQKAMVKTMTARPRLLIAAFALSLVMALLAACGGSEEPTATTAPTSTPAPTNTPSQMAPTAAPTATAEMMPDTPDPSPTSEPAMMGRSVGEYDGVTFVVTDGSEATFTVEEQLVRLPLPNDAVMRTTTLSGEVRLDGGESSIQIDLHTLVSDQEFRDRYVRTRMFGSHQYATFTVPDVGSLPDGLDAGETVTTTVSGSLDIRGITVPMEFDIEARDDGSELFILGRTTFTWQELDIPPPTAPSVASIEDEVRVEVLLAVVPQ